ncbi:MAG TPA: GAF domain-containing protein [Anaeromyxobacteraceae bacterium]|nr:GAF domain-containing protein [Anaeromyxobacteraceae bacterium]
MSDSRSAKPGAPGERPGKDLTQVNEKLRELIASLKSARERHDAGAAITPVASPTPAPAGAASDELHGLREALAKATSERDALRKRLADLEVEVGKISDDYVLVQEQSSEMAQLYVALERLHGGLTREETLQALQEIVINVVGSEEFAVFERAGDRLALVHHFGVDPVPLRAAKLGEGVIGRTAQRGKLFIAGRDGPVDAADADVSACIPLMRGDDVWGVVTIFRLLGHKPGIAESDQVVFELIRSHAGIALSLRPAQA